MSSVFSETDYRAFVERQFEASGRRRGYLAELARAMRCHRSVMPQVLSGKVELTMDQAAELARHWQLAALETDYFLELVGLARATSVHLKGAITRRLATLREQGLSLKRGIPATVQQRGSEVDGGYYASWKSGAVHVLIGMLADKSGEAQVAALAARLGLASEKVVATLNELERMGLVDRDARGGWRDLGKSLHLAKESPMHAVNSANWRMRAIAALDRQKPADLHYTGLHGLSHAAKHEVRVLLSEFFKTIHAKIAAAPHEEAICLTVDLFDV